MNLKKHYDAVASLGCLVCRDKGYGFVPAQIHHPFGRANGHEREVLPLCFSHHQAGVKTDYFVSRHPFKREFERRYGTEKELLAKVEELLNGRPSPQPLEAVHGMGRTTGAEDA